MPPLTCPCGYEYPEILGRYGCPNCEGDAMTAAERQQRKRDRQKAGLVRVEVWVPAQAVEAVQAAIAAALEQNGTGTRISEQASEQLPGVNRKYD